MNLSPNFVLSEFISPRDDAWPSEKVVANLIQLCARVLEPLRRDLGRPVRITSGWRSWRYNLKVAGTIGGQHPRGTAADFAVRDDADAIRTIALLTRNQAVGGLGFYPGRAFVHVDIRPRKRGNLITTWMQTGGRYGRLTTAIRAALLANGAIDLG